jgi:hypothetical protein
VSANMNAHLYTKKERDIHTICKRCKAQAPINCSKEDYNLFLNCLPTHSHITSGSSICFFTDQFRLTCMHLCFLCSGVHDCVGEYMCDLHVLRNKRS